MTLSQSPTILPTIIGLNAKAMALLQRAGNRLEYFGVTQKEYAEGSVWDFGIHSPEESKRESFWERSALPD